MNRHIAVMLLVGLVAALDPSATVQAADCVPWAETTDLPDVYPEVQLDRMAVAGSLLVGTKDQVFYVYRLDGQDDPELISSVSMGQYINRIRVLEGHVYLMPWSGTSWYVELADPDHPQLVPVAVPAGDLRDVARFDGGYLMLTSADSVFVVDDPTAAEVGIISAFEIASPNRAAAHGSVVFVAMSNGVKPVDLADPANPIVGVHHHFHPPGGGMWSSVACKSLVVHEGVLYGHFGYYYINYGAAFTMAIDITNPFEPFPMVRHPEPGVDGGLEIMGDLVVALTGSTLQIYETGDLEPVATIHINNLDARAGAVFGEDYLIAVPYRGLHRVDLRNPFTVEPTVTLPDGYDPAGCGRYGLATQRTYGYDWEGNGYLRDVDWTIYDQTSVIALDSLAAGHIDVHSDEYMSCSYSMAIADANDRWVVVRAHASYSGWDYDYAIENLVIHDLETGNRDEVYQQSFGQVALADDILWTLCSHSYSSSLLQTYRLTDDGAVQLGLIEFPYGTRQLYVTDEVYVVGPTTVTALSLSEPENLTPIRELHVDQDLVLYGPGYVEDGQLVTPTNEGLAVVDLDPASPGDPVVIGSCELEIGSTWKPLVRQGDHVILHRNEGWQAVDLADPTMPVAASPVIETRVSGLHWSGHLLYINTGTAIHLYDVTDFANPQWVGQSTYQSSLYTSPCGLDGYVISAEHALLPDCNDFTPIEPIDPDEPNTVPIAVTLAPVVPNPFNPSTTITFELRHTERVELVVHDLRGRRLATLLDRECPPGRHNVQWQGRDDHGRALPSGTYLVQMRTESAVRSTKAVLVR